PAVRNLRPGSQKRTEVAPLPLKTLCTYQNWDHLMKMNKLTAAIIISMLCGILTGQGYRVFAPEQAAGFADDITILTDIFLRLIKMIIAPLVFTTLVVGIAKMGDTRTVGRIGAKTLGWF